MTVWETVKADPFAWMVLALFVVVLAAGLIRVGQQLLGRWRR